MSRITKPAAALAGASKVKKRSDVTLDFPRQADAVPNFRAHGLGQIGHGDRDVGRFGRHGANQGQAT